MTYTDMVLGGDLLEWLQQPVTISMYTWWCQYCIKRDMEKYVELSFKGAPNTATKLLQKDFPDSLQMEADDVQPHQKVQELPLIIPKVWTYATVSCVISRIRGIYSIYHYFIVFLALVTF